MKEPPKLDWRIERLFRAVALFDQLHVLEEAIERLRKNGWIVHEFDCQQLTSEEELLNAVLHEMSILKPDFIYKNIKMIQFWDLLRGAQVPADTGLVLAFKHLDAVQPEYPDFFQQLLKSIAIEHYYQLHRGLRFMACVHLTDQTMKFEPLYTIKASWNEQPAFTEEADKEMHRKLESARRHMEAAREAVKWLNEHGYPELRVRTLRKALNKVTATTGSNSVADVSLDASEIVRLLKDFDFDSLDT